MAGGGGYGVEKDNQLLIHSISEKIESAAKYASNYKFLDLVVIKNERVPSIWDEEIFRCVDTALSQDKKMFRNVFVIYNEYCYRVDSDGTHKKIRINNRDGKKDSPGYRMPLFAYHEVDILSNLYKYDYDEFYEQLDNTDINVNTGDALIEFVLTMISVYDQNKDMKFLDLADYLLSKIKPYINEYLFLLNDMQIRIRRRVLQENELQLLADIPESDTCVAFGKYVLLGNKEVASKKFDALSKDKRELYRTYPIYHLFEEL